MAQNLDKTDPKIFSRPLRPKKAISLVENCNGTLLVSCLIFVPLFWARYQCHFIPPFLGGPDVAKILNKIDTRNFQPLSGHDQNAVSYSLFWARSKTPFCTPPRLGDYLPGTITFFDNSQKIKQPPSASGITRSRTTLYWARCYICSYPVGSRQDGGVQNGVLDRLGWVGKTSRKHPTLRAQELHVTVRWLPRDIYYQISPRSILLFTVSLPLTHFIGSRM